ncbi:sugar porter family MFS transporter [Pseudomonadales bacterium]|nr:sugar porter family MFS transporter [Pseudomonadales bacterium]MDB2449319.1 sugar porter family MFS transporter [Pseudomonadales bacterium]
MNSELIFTIRTSLIVALGGFLMGFDASVISGVVGFIELEFSLSKIQLGWAVASLALSSTFAMLIAGPLSQKVGRRKLLTWAAFLYLISALGSAFAPDFVMLIAARMIGGLAVGAALILAPMYIAELAPPAQRGRLVSINQLNIVIGISVAFFSNYLIQAWSQSGSAIAVYLRLDVWQWRWMLGLEALPALLYLVGLRFVPESPRWLLMKNRPAEALTILTQVVGPEQAKIESAVITDSLSDNTDADSIGIVELFRPALHKVLFVGVIVAILQQITGINSVFFYAPMIFEQTGIGTDASFLQAVLVGLTNLLFTIVAMLFIDKVGRRPLLLAGVSGIVVCMLMLAYGFDTARYTLPVNALSEFSEKADTLASVAGQTFRSDVAFREAISNSAGAAWYTANEARLIQISVSLNSYLILFGILGFVASFAVSLGPVMWVLFSELFPNHIRALAISVVGLVNSAVSFLVQLVFPWELATIGIAGTFFIYGFFALVGLLLVAKFLPETKGMSLEQLEVELVKS